MLGLRKTFDARRKRKSHSNSASSSVHTVDQQPTDDSPSRAAMDTIRQSMSGSLPSIMKTQYKNPNPDPVTVTVHEAESSDADSEDRTTMVSSQVSKTSSSEVKTSATHTSSTTVSTSYRYERMIKTSTSVRKMICRLDGYDETFVSEMDLGLYLQYISDERLIHMPRRGSAWDRVLKTAQFFGLQISAFAKKLEAFGPGGHELAMSALAACHILLEIGHGQAKALVPTFAALHELAILLSDVGQIQDLSTMPPTVKENVMDLLCDLVRLVGSISTYYRHKIDGLRPGASVQISFDAAFGTEIDEIWKCKTALWDRICAFKVNSRSINVKALMKKLHPSAETSIRNTLYDEVLEHLDRTDDTCYWIKDTLIQFFSGKQHILNVSGSAGTGKSTIAEWVEERLARPLDHKAYSVLTYKVFSEKSKDATSLACVKSLLFQLIKRRVGDGELFEQLAKVFEEDHKSPNATKLEEGLWSVLAHGLRHAERGPSSLVLLLDGCDAIEGGEKAKMHLYGHLQNCTSNLSRARVVFFSGKALPASNDCKTLEVTKKLVHNDIKVHLRQTLSESVHFTALSAAVREQMLDGLVARSNGNFLWAFYAGQILFREKSHEALVAKEKTLGSDISTLLDLVVKELSFAKNEMLQHILSFMLVSERPFTIDEASQLLSVDVHKHTICKTPFNLFGFVSKQCGNLLVIRDGHLHFRSSLVRTHLHKMLGHQLLSAKQAHLMLTMRLLLYVRLCVDIDQEPSIDGLDDSFVETLMCSHHLLGYAVRNWVIHFRHSGSSHTDGTVSLPKGFADIFPTSISLALLERSCWHSHVEVSAFHELSLHVRKACFGEKHITVLQNLITLGHVHLQLSTSGHCGATYLYKAIKLGRAILSDTTSVVVACTHLFLKCTETIVITKRTEIITYREETIRFMIQICKHKHGSSSDEVICWYETLAKLYVDIKEEHHATVIYRELYEIVVHRFGKRSPKAVQIGKFFGTLDIVLKGEEAKKNVSELEELVFETSEEMEITDQLCITMLLRLARTYISCGHVFLAERLYISLWRRISIICRVNTSVEVHILKIQIALEYAKFLREIRRKEEATTILICLWAEYEHHHCESDTLIFWVKEIGILCRTFGLWQVTVSILNKVWGWFKGKGKADDEEARKTIVLITEVVEEITETTTTTTTTTTTITEVTETVVKEIFEMHYKRCKKTTVDHAFFSACKALVALYIQRKCWSEAEVVITRTLEITWKAILSAEVKIKLCEHSVLECIHMARHLAICYHRQGFFEKAEHIHLKIYHACCSLPCEDASAIEAISVLIAFYEEHHRHEKVLEIYIEILGRYRKHLGASHHLTIEILYALAGHCEMLGRKDAYGYYLEIVTILNKGHRHCHHDAFKAAMILCKHYHSHSKWVELRTICISLWETIVHHHHECSLTEEMIVDIYEKYSYVLEVHAKVEWSILYNLTVEYKKVVTTICGVSSSAVIIAMIALAKICEKHTEHYHESIDIYEEVIKKVTTTKTTTTTVTETTVKTVKKRLSKMYVTVITTGKSGGTVTTTSFERAIEICIEAYELLKIEFGCWHEKTLLKLKEIVILCGKAGTKEHRVRMIHLLQLSITEIVTTITQTTYLFSAAKTLASIYITVGLAKEGYELLHALEHLVIFGGTLPHTGVTLKLDAHLSNLVFIFLIAFNHGLHDKDGCLSLSEMMTDIALEYLLYREYTRAIEHEKRTELVLECGARLRGLWVERKRVDLLVIIDKRLFTLFKTTYSASFSKLKDEHLHLFYLALLTELSKDRGASKIDLGILGLKAGNAQVKALIDAGDFVCATHVAHCVYQFASKQSLYRRKDCIQYGYKLAEFLAGIDVPHPPASGNSKVREAMLEASREVMTEVLASFRAAQIDFLSLRFEDLSGLIRLLGAQGNFIELEALLSQLWDSREVMQRSSGWSPARIISIGKLRVHALYAHGHTTAAIEMAELLYYNLRRGRGRLDPETLAVSRLLASLRISSGHAADAMNIHEGILREIVTTVCYADATQTPDIKVLGREGHRHLELLRSAHHQMNGWTKPVPEFRDLFGRLKSGLSLDIKEFDKWTDGAGEESILAAKYVPPTDWKIDGDVKDVVMWKRRSRQNVLPDSDLVSKANQWWLVY